MTCKDKNPDEAARAWIVRLASGDMTEAELARLKAWLAESESHQAAFAEARAFWQDLAALEPAFRRAEAAAPRKRRFWPARGLAGGSARVRRATLPAVLALAACLTVALVLPQAAGLLSVSLRADHASGAAATLEVTLPDGSLALLDRGSALALHFDDGQRRVELLRGAAFFQVRPDPARPFRVQAGGGISEAVGTAYAVRLSDEGVRVTVTEGRVAVSAAAPEKAAAAETEVLGPGEALRYLVEGAPGRRVALDADRALAWRDGRVIFVARPLKEALAELERYRRGRIVLLADGRRLQPVSGVIDLDRLDEGLAALAATHGLRVTEVTPFLTVLR